MSAPNPVPASVAPPAPASRAFACGVLAYAVLAFAGWLTSSAWLDVLAAFALLTVLLLPGLRGRRGGAWAGWLASGALLGLLALRGEGRFALDLMPALVNAILCNLFARTLAGGREPPPTSPKVRVHGDLLRTIAEGIEQLLAKGQSPAEASAGWDAMEKRIEEEAQARRRRIMILVLVTLAAIVVVTGLCIWTLDL